MKIKTGLVTAGVKYGRVMPPMLNIAYMDNVMRKYKEGRQGSEDIIVNADDVLQ